MVAVLNCLVKVGEEKDWPEDICRHLVEATLQVDFKIAHRKLFFIT